MDVTSLLNAGSNAVEQQKQGEVSRTHPRSRTPWDAGGYSLPINTISSKTSPTSPPSNIHHDDSQIETPTSPRHKFSDSRSSLSSFTSSLQSASHSRFSSMSTVNSAYQMNSLVAETLSPSQQKPQPFDLSSISLPTAEAFDGTRPSTCNTQHRGSLSPTDSLDALALVAENRMAGQQYTSTIPPSTEASSMSSATEKNENRTAGNDSVSPERPSSPSDAILIKRSTIPILRVNTGDQDLNGPESDHSQIRPSRRLLRPRSHLYAYATLLANKDYLSAPLENHQEFLLSRTHKRALSAPDFPAPPKTFTMAFPKAEPTPPSSHHPDHASPRTLNHPAPDTPPTASEAENQPVVCMYIPNCDTGSQPRKAISHIFGRNKMCTRLIPQSVWVHYCRKHYQRSRYRNPKEYAKLQCDLVQQQIRRVHDWSLANMKNGAPGVVQDWGLAVRKREQKRLDDLGGAKRKRSAAAFDNDSDDGENGDDGSRGNPVPATAVPEWLLALCGKGYNTQSILEIFNRLHTEILEDTLPCFPDIEILPNIVVDSDEPKSPKGYAKRTPVGNAHKRSQSLGMGAKSDLYGQNRRSSQPSIWGPSPSGYNSPVQKRRRPNDADETNSPDRVLPPFQRSRMVERPLEAGRRMQQFPHRPVFANIDEHQSAEDDYYAFSPQTYQAPLPAPTPQRMNGHSMAAHLETNEYSSRRPMHQRSHSDMGGFVRARMDYSPAPSSAYPADANYQGRSYHGQEPSQVGSYGYQQNRWEPTDRFGTQYGDMRATTMNGPSPWAAGHARHSSSPMTSYAPPSVQGMRQGPSSYSQTQPHNSLHGPHIHETAQARTLFSSRR